MGRRRFALLAPLLAIIGLAPVTASADTASARVERQQYTTSLPAGDPCSGQTPADICVSAASGQPTAQSYLYVDLSELTSGATLDKLTLKLVPDAANTAGNVNGAGASLDACVLSNELPDNVQSSGAPPSDCGKASAPGIAQADGSWTFDLTPLARVWQSDFNSGAAIIPTPQQLPVQPPVQPVANPGPAESFSVAFKTTETAASLDFTPAFSPSYETPPQLSLAPPAPTTALPAPGLVLPRPATPNQAPPAVRSRPAVVPQAHTALVVSRFWLLATLLLAGLCLGLLAGAAFSNVRVAGGLPSASVILRSISLAWSQQAATLGLLLVGALVGLGLIGQLVLLAQTPNGGVTP